tara:strand:+ start:277 stop:489 length:213 start_codon:yes stop_codon:yes gene_type:complete
MIININSSQDRKEKKMSFLTKLTFWDGVEMTALFMIMMFSILWAAWELYFSPSAKRERKKVKEAKKSKET